MGYQDGRTVLRSRVMLPLTAHRLVSLSGVELCAEGRDRRRARARRGPIDVARSVLRSKTARVVSETKKEGSESDPHCCLTLYQEAQMT